MNAPEGLVLIGFGGHARSVADVALSSGYRNLIFVDEHAREGEAFLGFPVRLTMPEHGDDWVYMPCSGNNARRLEQLRELEAAGLPVTSIVSLSATIGARAMIGAGSFIGHHAHLGPMARIGDGCILNTGAIVEHDCVIGEGVHVSVKCAVAGASQVGDRCFLGAGSTVIDKITIGCDVTVGAGGVVISPIDQPGVYVGVPVRKL